MKIKVTDILNFIASNLGFTPTGGVTATNVQSAIAEVDTKKVAGPSSATANALVRYDGASGKLVKNSSITGNDSGALSANGLTISGSSFLRNGNIALYIGADSGASTVTDSTQKAARMGIPHYLNSEEPVAIFLVTANPSSSSLQIGGGSGLFNAATEIQFLTAANNTTTVGTVRARITNAGRLQVDSGMLAVPGLVNAIDDAAAAAAGVPVNQFYRNGSQVMIRVS